MWLNWATKQLPCWDSSPFLLFIYLLFIYLFIHSILICLFALLCGFWGCFIYYFAYLVWFHLVCSVYLLLGGLVFLLIFISLVLWGGCKSRGEMGDGVMGRIRMCDVKYEKNHQKFKEEKKRMREMQIVVLQWKVWGSLSHSPRWLSTCLGLSSCGDHQPENEFCHYFITIVLLLWIIM